MTRSKVAPVRGESEQQRQARREQATAERRRRLEIADRQHAARMAGQDRRLDEALGEGRR
jgi:hypothetical protein